MVIPCQFGVWADPAQFHEGVAIVCYENEEDSNPLGWPFLIDEQGAVIPLPEGLHPCEIAVASEGLIAVEDEQGLRGYVDLSGRVVIAPQFRAADNFHEGLAAVRLPEGDWGYIDPTGRVVLRGYTRCRDFEGGYAEVDAGSGYVWIDRQGNIVPGTYLSNGLAWVREKDEQGRDTIWSHLVDQNGQQVGPHWRLTDYSDSRRFDEGRQPVRDENGLFCYLDDTGAVAIPGPFVSAAPFCNGLARVCTATREGYIDREGNQICFWER